MPETDPQIELPEFSIKDINYKPSVPEGLDMSPTHFEKMSKNFFDYFEKDFPEFKKDFDDADNTQKKSQLVKDNIVKYYDYLLSLDPKIRTHASSKSAGKTFNQRCSYMTLFLIGQKRYAAVLNPDYERQYPVLLYGKSKITEQMDVHYNGQHVEFPILEIDAQVSNINRAWNDPNNKLMMYSPARTMMDAQDMSGGELNPEQIAAFADALRIATLKHEGTHALLRHMFPEKTTDKNLRSAHTVPLEKGGKSSNTRELRHTVVKGIEANELTAVGVELANFHQFLKFYLSKMIPQTYMPDQYQQAYLHLLTHLANRATVPLPLRLKVQAYLAKFPRGNPSIIHEVMIDPSLQEAELRAIGKQLFATGIRMFEHMENE